MSADLMLNDDDLTLYALRLLTPAEAESVARRLRESTDDQIRLAAIQMSLGIFAEAHVDEQEVPEESLQRLLRSIDQDRPAEPAVAAAIPVREGRPRWSFASLLPWTGWAVAAVLVGAVAGHYVPRESQLRRELATAAADARQADSAAKQAQAQSGALQTALQQRTEEALSTQNRVSDVERQAAALRAKADAAAAEAARQGAKAGDLASTAEATSRERDALQGQLNAQSAEAAQLAAQSDDAKRVVSALSDPAALRVTLTVPKKKVSPSGRGAYLASTGALVFIGSNLPSPKGNKVYELWLMPSDGSSPLPAGTFVPDAAGNATVVNSKFRQNVNAKGFAVTIENQGGSQTPTLPIVLAGL